MVLFARSLNLLARNSAARSPSCLRSVTCAHQRIQYLSTTAPGAQADVLDTVIPPSPITHMSEVETMMAESVSKFAQETLLPRVRDMDEAEKMDPAVIEQLFEQGLMGIEIPEEYGGAGMNFTAGIVGIEELARVDPSVSVLVDVHNTLVNTAILKYGTAESKRRWLPKLATETVGSFCLSEPASGSDAFAMRTKAEKTADGYRINGSKMWITNAMEAGFFIVFANLDPSKGYRGITAFVVEKSNKGFSIAKKEKKLGIRASSTCVVNFDDVEIPRDQLLGEEGQGYKYAIGLLNEGRIGIAAQMTGLALGAWENAAGYVWNDRKQFGQLVGEFQGMQHQLAQAYTEISAARALVYNAARKKEAGEDFVRDSAMAKLFASQVAGRVSGSAIEWMGGMGFVREGIAEKMWRDSKIGAIYEGTSNIQMQTIAKLLQKERFKNGRLNDHLASIARIEGQNWRHGDIEDTLLNILMSRAAGGKKFSKLDVKRVYFGNWLRDYSQAVDVGTVKYVSAEAIRILLWVLGFMSFGYGTKEFEVTTERLGCYRPEEHIDNPKDVRFKLLSCKKQYADNLDARQYDRRLRGPVDERRELSVNPQTGLKNYIATEGMGIATSAGLVRDLFGRSIQLGRQYARSENKADLYEASRLLGTGCHCLEDYSAHSNYTELALIELGEHDVFPHVGRRTQITLPENRRAVFPIITGTFGGVDFLHSVMGEFSDKATQSEIQELEGTIEQSQGTGNNTSVLQDLLNQVPSGLFGGKDQAGKADELQMNAQSAQMQNTHISPREPEAWTQQLEECQRQIYPILEWHDEMMQSITEAIEKIPILPDLIEQLQEQLNIFIFSLLAPFVLPIIKQVKVELNTGSSEIIESSREKQLIVFYDDYSSDPTHSMLSKDHFSNILNEPAGKVASQVLKWVVPQLIACWDDERIDVDRTLTRVVDGVFHHPSLRDYGNDGVVDGRRLMFGVVEQWWGSKDEGERQIMRDQLNRNGVEQGLNHKPGVQDSGHGCGKPLGMPTTKTAQSSGAIGGLAGAGVLGEITSALAGESKYDAGYTGERPPAKSGGSLSGIGKFAEEAVGGGMVGGLVGGIVGGVGDDLLGDAFGGSKAKKQTYGKQQYGDDGGYTQSLTETGYSQPQYGSEQQRYGQAEYSQTTYPSGGQRQEYQRYQQDDRSGIGGYGAYGEQVIRESRPQYGGGYEQSTETRFEGPAGEWQSEVRREGRDAEGEFYRRSEHHEGKKYGSGGDSDDSEKKRRKKEKKKEKRYRKHGSGDESTDDDEEKKSKKHGGGYGGGYGERREEYGEGLQDYSGSSGYPSWQQQQYGGGGGYGGQQQHARQGYGEGRQEYRGRSGYGSQQQEYGGERGGGYGGQQQYGGGYGGGYREPPREERRGMGAFGGAALGLGAGAIGGAMLGHEYSERREEEREEARDEEYSVPGGFGAEEEGGYGGDDGYGGGDDYQERSGRGYGDDY
ncbi:MAG: hypothetical protein Q9173_006494 [Seirophora scorigena]